jgi:SNF2 family DNA or RNA helicase
MHNRAPYHPYKLMNKPFAHQRKSIAKSAVSDIVFDCSDPGTGKTAVRIWVFAARRKKKGKCALVLAPKTLLRNVWQADVKKFAPHLKTSVSTAESRGTSFEVDADMYITNIDAVKWLAQQPKKFFGRFDELIVDESSFYKHPTSQRSKAVAKITKYFTYRTCMTGTPNGRSITDVWHQVYLLDGGKRLGNSFYGFRNTVCDPRQMGSNKNAIQWTDKDGAEEAVFSLLSDIVVRHEFEKCVDIPANHEYALEYELSAKHLKAYAELERTQMLLVKKSSMSNMTAKILGEKPKDFAVVSAVNAAVAANKLLQLASGAVYESTDNYHLIDDGRYKMTLDLVEAREHSLVLFQWKHQRDLLIKEADARGVTFCVIDGATPDDERREMVERYQRGFYQVMFGHPKSVGHGLTLTKGTTTIWPSPIYDLELYVQASKRQHRMGQTKKTETITLIAPGTIDTRVYGIRKEKGDRMRNLLDLFASI